MNGAPGTRRLAIVAGIEAGSSASLGMTIEKIGASPCDHGEGAFRCNQERGSRCGELAIGGGAWVSGLGCGARTPPFPAMTLPERMGHPAPGIGEGRAKMAAHFLWEEGSLRTLRNPVSFLAVLLVGLIAGLLLGTAMEQGTLRVLDGPAWVTARHGTDALFGRVLPWFWNTTLVLLFVAGRLNRGVSRWMFVTAGMLLLVGIVVTVGIEVPMNKQIASWDAGAVPAGWAAVRERWLGFHNVRTGLGIGAFICALVGITRGRRESV